MATEQGPNEFDLDRTDRLPILTGISLEGLEDDSATPQQLARISAGESSDVDLAEATGRLRAVSVDLTGLPSTITAGGLQTADFIRPSSIDLPSLAESVRSVEERIARQHADYESLNRSYERARDAETVALAKAASFERELAHAAHQPRGRADRACGSTRSRCWNATASRRPHGVRPKRRCARPSGSAVKPAP